MVMAQGFDVGDHLCHLAAKHQMVVEVLAVQSVYPGGEELDGVDAELIVLLEADDLLLHVPDVFS